MISLVVSAATLMLLIHCGIAAADPIIYPSGGTYYSAQSVTISNIPSGYVAYYTTDGSNPETSSTLAYYSGPFTVSQSETVQVAMRGPSGWGDIVSATFSISSSSGMPIISPNGGTYTTPQSVTIGNLSGTTYYTTDGSNPESSSTRITYAGAFTVSQTETIQAVNYNSAGWSSLSSATFYISASSGAPIISPNGGTYTTPQSLTISNIPSGGEAYYTCDGTNPENSTTRNPYNGAFTVGQSETIQAVDYSSAGWSGIISATFNISSSAGTPVISPNGGSYTSAQSVTISGISGTTYYTIDGSNPESSSTRIMYTGAFTVSQTESIQAVNYSAGGWTGVTSAAFYIGGSNGTPIISPDGGTYASPQSVTISGISGATYYTIDGSNPKSSSTRIIYTGAFTVSQTESIQAADYSSAGWSGIATTIFYINTSSGAPVISPNGGSYTSAQSVTISSGISGTTYYTIDGSNPESSSTRIIYTGAFTVSQTESIQAVNYSSSGWSGVTSAAFTISSGSSTVTLLSAPSVVTNNASSAAGNYVTLSGSVTNNGGDVINAYGFSYSTDQNQWTQLVAGTDNHFGSYSYSLTGLIANTNYYFKAYATNPEGTSYGSVVSFLTSAQSTQAVGLVINPDGGTYTSAQSVTFNNIPSGDIAYYTTDGSNPATSSSAVAYSGAFTVSQTDTVQVAIHDPTSGWGSLVSATFTISQQPVQTTTTSSSNSSSSSDQVDQLQQEFATAISYNQINQATQILSQIVHLEQLQDTTANLEGQLIAAYNASNWGSAETILKTIISIENPGWAYSQLGQIYQQQNMSSISVFVNGNEVSFDVQPVIVNNRVLVPIRNIANALGLSNNNITYASDGTVTINSGSNAIVITNNAQQVSLNGNPYSLDTPAQIIDGRMMVPLRAISILLNKNVQWYPTGQIVEIS
jgi:hypothetical protein